MPSENFEGIFVPEYGCPQLFPMDMHCSAQTYYHKLITSNHADKKWRSKMAVYTKKTALGMIKGRYYPVIRGKLGKLVINTGSGPVLVMSEDQLKEFGDLVRF